MIICNRCHAQMDDGSVFCDVCGNELLSTPSRTWPTAPPSTGAPLPAPIAPAPSQGGPPHHGAAGPSLSGQPPVVVLRLANGQRFVLRGKSEYTVGRIGSDRSAPDVDLSSVYGFEAGVSREHVLIQVRPDGVFVLDLESRNETVQNGYRLLPRQWYPLRDGDELKLGALTLYVTFERA